MLSKIKKYTTQILKPITGILNSVGIKPNHLTFIGLFLGVLSAYLIAKGLPIAGAITILLSGLMDMLDGALARNFGKVSPFGGFLDSVFDRYVDVAIFIALGFYTKKWFLACLALSGALLVSYTRARAEHIIDKCDVGFAERGERLIIIVLGLFTGYVWQSVALVAFFAHLTAIHRIIYTWNKT